MKIGEQFQCEISACGFGGDGIARYQGVTVFIPGALPGERVIAELTGIRRDFWRARVVRFGSRSPERCEPACPLAGRCPGCSYQHCSYELENQLKQAQLANFPAAVGVTLPPPLAPEPVLGYRNKLVLHVRQVGRETEIGYVGSDNVTVCDLEACPLAHPAINAKLRELRADPGFAHTVRDGMELTLRYTEKDGVSYWRNRPSIKLPPLHETTSLGELLVPPGAFFQVNRAGMELLLGLLREVLLERPRGGFLDLYCGVGLFGCAAAAAGVERVVAVELDAAAADCARTNLRRCGAAAPEVIAAEAEKELPRVLEHLPEDTLTVVDPPRTGLHGRAVAALNAGPLRELIYISCHPATWSRDAGRLAAGGWRLQSVRLVNLFPRTGHFELFSRFSRG